MGYLKRAEARVEAARRAREGKAAKAKLPKKTWRDYEVERVVALRDKVKLLGRGQSLENLETLIWIRDNDPDNRLKLACIEIMEDRWGFPRTQVFSGVEDAKPKLFEIRKYPAPASYSEEPPPPAAGDAEPAVGDGDKPLDQPEEPDEDAAQAGSE